MDILERFGLDVYKRQQLEICLKRIRTLLYNEEKFMPRTMTSKERVKAAFAHNPVDRVPMMILLGETWMIEREKISFKDLREMDDLGAELIVRTYDEMQSDSCLLYTSSVELEVE